MARIVIRQEPNEGYNPFARRDLLPPKKGQPGNVCGEQDGLSVDRSSELTPDALNARSAARATTANAKRELKGKAANQFAGGAAIAQVGVLRSLSYPSADGKQAIFIYDDALEGNAEHAVIRMSAIVPEEEMSLVIDDLKRSFDTIVEPTQATDATTG